MWLQHPSLYERVSLGFFALNLLFCKTLKAQRLRSELKRWWQDWEQNIRGTLNLLITPHFLSSTVQLSVLTNTAMFILPPYVLCGAKRKLPWSSCVRSCQAPFSHWGRRSEKHALHPRGLLQLQRSCVSDKSDKMTPLKATTRLERYCNGLWSVGKQNMPPFPHQFSQCGLSTLY